MSSSLANKPSAPIPKYIRFFSDGFGRDTYITYNNGGFLGKLDKVKSADKYNVVSNIRYFNTKKNIAPLKYRSDGTGRDNYILFESGGLEKDHRPLKTYELKTFLRNSKSTKFNFNCDPLKEGVQSKSLYISKNEFNNENKIKSLEKDLANRLYYSETYKFMNNKLMNRYLFKFHKFIINYLPAFDIFVH